MRVALRKQLLVLMAALLLPAASLGQDVKTTKKRETTPSVLFVCEHGAAKSAIAAAYFDKLAKERGLKYRAVFRGTNPDPALAPAAVKGLKLDGFETKGWKPELVTKNDLDTASRIVTLGCDVPGRESVAEKLDEWNNIPSPGQDYTIARDDILKRVQSLVDELAKKERENRATKKAQP